MGKGVPAVTQTIAPNDPEVRDFTHHVDVRFRIDDDLFVGLRGLPALKLMAFGAMYDGLSASDIMSSPDTFTKMFKMVLEPASAERFIERMNSDEEPISMPQVMDVIPWIMEKYGLRPLEQSSDSSAGPENPVGTTSSTVSSSTVELTSQPFQPTAS